MSTPGWEGWLREWNRQLLERYDPGEYTAFVDPAVVTPELLASGWLGFPGASEEEVSALEARLGKRLPPSYRSFLRTSNGFIQPGVIVPRLRPAQEVDWYRVANQETIDIWLECAREQPPTGPEVFEHHLPHALQISDVERVGSAVYLLNPDVVGPDGEWEAFYFADWVPGADRYPSFWELMQWEQRTRLAPPRPPPPSQRKTFWDALRWAFRR